MSSLADASVAPRASAWGRFRGWLSNPWGRPRFLPLLTWGYVVWSIVPVLIAVQFSFNATRSRTNWEGFSTRWYWGDPVDSVWHDPTLRNALAQSLKLAVADSSSRRQSGCCWRSAWPAGTVADRGPRTSSCSSRW